MLTAGQQPCNQLRRVQSQCWGADSWKPLRIVFWLCLTHVALQLGHTSSRAVFFSFSFFFFFSPLYGLWPLLTVEWAWKVNLLWDCRLLFWNPAWNLTFSIFLPEFVLLLHGIAWLSFGFAVAGRTGRQRWQNLNHLYSETWTWKRSSSLSCHAVSQKHQKNPARWQSSTSLVFRF